MNAVRWYRELLYATCSKRSKAAECLVQLCQVHTRVHQLWVGKLWRWSTLEVSACVHLQLFCLSLLDVCSLVYQCVLCVYMRERAFSTPACSHSRTTPCVHLTCMCFPLFSHSGTLPYLRCVNQSAEREREREGEGRENKIWGKPWC